MIKKNVLLKILSIVVLLSFISDVVFIDFASARPTVKKNRFDIMDEEPDTRRSGASMNQETVDNKNALLEMMANFQNVTVTDTSNTILSDPGQPHEMDPRSHEDMMRALDLVQDQDATFILTADANLSDLISQGIIQENAKVVVAEGWTLTIDTVSDVKVEWIRVDGALKFSTDRNTKLSVGTLIVNHMGSLNIGSLNDRVQAGVTARLIFADYGSVADDPNDPTQIGHGLIVAGKIQVYGAESAANPLPATVLTAGTTQVTFTESAMGWQVGDEILLVSTANSDGWNSVDQSEKVRISAISADGRTITFDRALAYDHVMPDGASPPVARMTRNVQFSSENQTDILHQGHIMIMGFADLNDASFTGLGRTTNAIVSDPEFDADGNIKPLTVMNVRARYAVHFHRTGINANSPVNLVKNVSIDAGAGSVVSRWGGANHSSNVNFIDNVFHGFSGANLMADEKGDSVGLVQGNVTSKSDGALSEGSFRFRGGDTVANPAGQRVEDVGHRGHGIYLQGGGGVTVTGNWVFGNNDAGIIYWRLTSFDGASQVWYPVENIQDRSFVDSIPLAAIMVPLLNGPPWFRQWKPGDGKQYVSINAVPVYCVGNVVGSSQMMITLGYNADMGGSDEEKRNSKNYSIIKDNIGFGFINYGIFIPYSSSVLLENNTVYRDNPNSKVRSNFTYGASVGGNDFTANINFIDHTAIGWEFGIGVPRHGLTVIKGGYLKNVVNIVVSAPFQGDSSCNFCGREMHRRVEIEDVQFGVHTGPRSYYPTPHIDIDVSEGYVNDNRAQGLDYSVWDPARNFISIRGKNLDSIILRMDSLRVVPGNPNMLYTPDFVSDVFTNQLTGYVPLVKGLYGQLFTGAPIDLKEGINVFKVRVDGADQTFFVWGDTQGPAFVPDPNMKLEIKASDLGKGFDVAGSVLDQVGMFQFQEAIGKHFDNLVPDANGIVKLQFEITDRAGNVSLITLDLKVIQNALPPAIQAIVDNLKAKLGETSTVRAYEDLSTPGNYIFIALTSVAEPGRVRYLRFYTDSNGKVDAAKPMIIYFTLPTGLGVVVDAKMLFAGLSQLPATNPVYAIADMVLRSSDSTGIRFELGGDFWKIYKDDNGNVILQKIMIPLNLSVSTSPYRSNPDLLVSIDENFKAAVTYGGQTHTGVYDEKTGQIVINFNQAQSQYTWMIQLSKDSADRAFLSIFENRWNGSASKFEFNSEGLLTHNSYNMSNNYSYDAYYTYVRIGDKNYLESMTQKGHWGYYWLNASGGCDSSTVLPNGYSWSSKTFYAYDDSGTRRITVSVGSRTPDNGGQATYWASYSLSEGNKIVWVSAYLDKDISELIRSAKDYWIIDQYAMFKTEYYDNYKISLTYVKDASGIFVARYAQKDGKGYIVQGKPDILFPDDLVKDIFILPWQNVNGYSIYFGAAYSYTHSSSGGGWQPPKYLGYGLVFSKWEKKSDGTYGNTTVVVDYPKTDLVALDGQLYQIRINAEGAVQLVPPILIDPAVGPTFGSSSWIQVQTAGTVAANQEISVAYKLAQPAPAGHHVHVSLSAKPVTSETVSTVSFDKIVMSWPDSDGQTGSASISTKGVGTGEYYISFWGVKKDHEYDGNGIVVRKIIINPV